MTPELIHEILNNFDSVWAKGHIPPSTKGLSDAVKSGEIAVGVNDRRELKKGPFGEFRPGFFKHWVEAEYTVPEDSWLKYPELRKFVIRRILEIVEDKGFDFFINDTTYEPKYVALFRKLSKQEQEQIKSEDHRSQMREDSRAWSKEVIDGMPRQVAVIWLGIVEKALKAGRPFSKEAVAHKAIAEFMRRNGLPKDGDDKPETYEIRELATKEVGKILKDDPSRYPLVYARFYGKKVTSSSKESRTMKNKVVASELLKIAKGLVAEPVDAPIRTPIRDFAKLFAQSMIPMAKIHFKVGGPDIDFRRGTHIVSIPVSLEGSKGKLLFDVWSDDDGNGGRKFNVEASFWSNDLAFDKSFFGNQPSPTFPADEQGIEQFKKWFWVSYSRLLRSLR